MLSRAYVGQRLNRSTGRVAKHYQCAKCLEAHPGKDVQVNHIIPVIPVNGFTTWDDVINRMFCEENGLEVLCKPCHKAVTKEENDERKLQRLQSV